MEYIVVIRLNIRQLMEDVNQRIAEGWIPFGSLAIDGAENNTEYLQPMIKYESISATYKGKPTEENIFTTSDIPATGEFEPIEETFTTTGIKDNEFDVSNVPITP